MITVPALGNNVMAMNFQARERRNWTPEEDALLEAAVTRGKGTQLTSSTHLLKTPYSTCSIPESTVAHHSRQYSRAHQQGLPQALALQIGCHRQQGFLDECGGREAPRCCDQIWDEVG